MSCVSMTIPELVHVHARAQVTRCSVSMRAILSMGVGAAAMAGAMGAKASAVANTVANTGARTVAAYAVARSSVAKASRSCMTVAIVLVRSSCLTDVGTCAHTVAIAFSFSLGSDFSFDSEGSCCYQSEACRELG